MASKTTRWQPSSWGKRIAKCNDWALSLDADELTLAGESEAATFTVGIGSIGDLTVTPGTF